MVVISNKLRKILADVNHSSPIATTVLTMSSSLSTIEWRSSIEIDYLDYTIENDKLYATYLPKIYWRNTSDPWSNRFRQKSSFGKAFRRLNNFPEEDIRNITELLKSRLLVNKNAKLSLVSGEDMLKAYLQTNYHSSAGTDSNLAKSCMRHEVCQDWLQFYAAFPDIVQLVVIEENKKVRARALVWSTLYKNKKVKVLDRIYSSQPNDTQAIKDWGHNNCDFIRFNSTEFHPKNMSSTIQCEFTIPIEGSWRFQYYPYIDTFYYLDKINNTLQNFRQKSFPNRQFRETNGNYIDSEGDKNSCAPEGVVYVQNVGLRPIADVELFNHRYELITSLAHCDICNQRTLVGTLTTLDEGSRVCSSHRTVRTIQKEIVLFTDAHKECGYCGLYATKLTNFIGVGDLCQFCFKKTFTCASCGEVHHIANKHPIVVGACNKCVYECYAKCLKCTYFFPKNGKDMCEDCTKNYTTSCDQCNLLVNLADGKFSIIQGSVVCNNCKDHFDFCINCIDYYKGETCYKCI